MNRYRSRFVSTFSALIVAGLARSSAAAPPQTPDVQELVRTLKISFSDSASGAVFLEQAGRRFKIDTGTRTITEVGAGGAPAAAAAQSAPQPASAGKTLFLANCARCHGPEGKGIPSVGTPDFGAIGVDASHVAQTIREGKGGKMPSFAGKLSDAEITEVAQFVSGFAAPAGQKQESQSNVYKPGDDVLFSLPTGRPVDRGSVVVNFTHRFPYDPAFNGKGRAGELFGLDDFSLSSLGFRYGVTDKLSVDVFRSPSFIGRPIQLMAAYSLLNEQKHAPFNLTARVSVEGQNNFRKNFTEDLEAIVSRSLTHHAQIYFVPTVSFNDRRVVQGGLTSNQIRDFPGINAFSVGAGAAVDIRPTVALVAEVIPTFVGADELGIHRPAFSFGIQKKIYRHAFTFGVTNSPGVTVSQRAGTDATFLGSPSGDVFKKVFLGFDLTRQIH